MIVRGLVMSRSGARWGLVLAGVAGLSLAIAFAPAGGAQTQATPVPVDCGVPISAWGGGIADDVSVELLGFELATPRSSGTPVATPESLVSVYFAELLVKNLGDTPATVVVADITLVLCDGREVQAVFDVTRPAFADGELPAGETQTGWVAFRLNEQDVPVRLIVPVSRPGVTGGRVEFPLTDPDAGTAEAEGQGATGADAVGGDAVGGDGGDGADATGAAGDSASGE
jgi:hypothetical protein